MEGEVDIVHFAKSGIIWGIDADGEAFEAGVAEGEGLFGEEGAVGGEGEVTIVGELSELGDELGEVASEEGFAAGDADFGDAEGKEDVGESGNFFEGENVGAGEKLVTATEDRFGHTIGATKVATIGHGNSQVVKWAGEGIYEVWQGSKAFWLRFLLRFFRIGLGMPVEE